jgi:CHAD domain-containing protein
MAFRLKRRGKIGDQLQELVGDELSAAHEALRSGKSDQEAIHEARTSIKKARAILRLVRKPLKSKYAKQNARLRAAAHALSALRDADATHDTLGRLHAQHSASVSSTSVRSIRRALRGRNRREKARRVRIVKRARAAVAASSETVPAQVGNVATFRRVHAGAVRGYRDARGALDGLAVDSETTAFHEWRKRVKDHWYHVRLFEGLNKSARTRVKTLKRLEQLLGDDHDLAVLRSILLNADERYGNARARAIVVGAIVESQTSLRHRAITLGRRTFLRSPREFGASMSRWWHDR